LAGGRDASSIASTRPAPAPAVALRRPRQLRADRSTTRFLAVARQQLWFALGTIPVSIALAMLMALWVNDRIAGAPVRMAYFTPTVLPMIAVANIWLFFYTPQYGCSSSLRLFGGPRTTGSARKDTRCRGDRRRDLEGGRLLHDLLPRGAAADLAQLAEAAALEGASRWTFFRRVQFPLLMPTTLFVLVNAVINAFRMVDHIVVMTQGRAGQSRPRCCCSTSTGRLQFLGHDLCGGADHVLLVLLAAPRACNTAGSSGAAGFFSHLSMRRSGSTPHPSRLPAAAHPRASACFHSLRAAWWSTRGEAAALGIAARRVERVLWR
jgi:hypothetical protein